MFYAPFSFVKSNKKNKHASGVKFATNPEGLLQTIFLDCLVKPWMVFQQNVCEHEFIQLAGRNIGGWLVGLVGEK